MKKNLNWITKDINFNNDIINSSKYIDSHMGLKYSFLYKLYFLYFFWSIFYLNKIFFNLNKIFFNLWNRFYYFFQNSYSLKNNKLIFSYIILYKKINMNIEFENKWNSFINFIKKNIIYYKENLFINYKIWKYIYNNIFIHNNYNIKNYIFLCYYKHLINLNINKYLNKNNYKYEKIDRINNILDNIWKNNYNYNIYYNYNYFSCWKIPSINNINFIDKIINKTKIEYKKINNFLENIYYNDKLIIKDYLIDSEIKNNIYYLDKLNRNKEKLWYK